MKRNNNNKSNKEFIFPGEHLGVIEEYIPGPGTFIEDGNIYSATIGQLQVDRLNKEVLVQSITKTPIIPQKDDIVIGNISYIQEKTLTVTIFQINDKQVPNSFSAVMHISNATTSYIRTMFDVFKVGDTIRARVLAIMNKEIHLSTEGKQLGVLQSVCSQCGDKLVLSNRRLRCPSCKKSERRKFAPDYVLSGNGS